MDEGVVTLAEGQHGVFTLGQARALGFTAAAVQHRLRSGRWRSVRPGIYRLPGAARTWEQRVMAAVLAAGPGAAASHRSAAALLGIPGFGREQALELTVLRPKRHRDASAVVHESRALPDSHLTRLHGIPSTRSARTLLDLAGTIPAARTERALDNCLSAGLVTLRALGAVWADLASPGRPGVALMRRLLEERAEGYVAPASELEARFLRLVRAAGLPDPVRQHDVGDNASWAGRVDFAYPGMRLLVELDSRRHHSAKLDFEADRERDNRHVAAGWRPIRFTWQQIHEKPDAVVDILLRSGVIRHRPGDAGCRRLTG